MRRAATTLILSFVLGTSPVWACGGLVAPNGSVNLVRTSTLSGYHNGVEHYITSFEFVGGGAKFGSIVPLPGRPKRVTRGGDWTLQRLAQEVAPPQQESDVAPAPAAQSGSAKEILEKEIDGLLITVLRGGSRGVGKWAKEEGFRLPPDAPEVLHFYAQRSRYFMAARFIPKKARKKQLNQGDGIPIHLRIPTDNPWVPLRILGLGKQPSEIIDADVFLLTDIQPALLPAPAPAGDRGMSLERSEQASQSLLNDLDSDKGMNWIQEESGMWLTYLQLDIDAGDLTYDLAVDSSGNGQPSTVDAFGKQGTSSSRGESKPWAWLMVPLVGASGVRLARRRVMPRR
jgi:uncharacterized protein DUF2330